MRFYGSNFSDLSLSSAASPTAAGWNWAGTGQRSGTAGVTSMAATLPKLQLSPRCNSYFQVRPILALSPLLKVQFISCPVDSFQYPQPSGDRSSSCAHQNMPCLQVPDAHPRVNKLDAAPLLPVIFRFSVFGFHVCLHRLLLSAGGRRWRHTFLPVSAVGTGELRALQLCPTEDYILLGSMMFRD